MNATLDSILADLDSIGLDELNKRAAMLTRVDRKYALDATAASAIMSHLPEGTKVLQINGQVSQGYASTYYDTPDMDSYMLTALKRRRRFKVRSRTYLSSDESFLEVKTRGPRGVTVKKRMPTASDEAGAPLAGQRRTWVAGKVEPTGYDHLVPALEPVLAGSYERNTLLLPGGQGRATVDTGLTWRSLRTDRTELVRPDLVIIEMKSGATPSAVDHLLWASGVRPVKISKYGTAMAAMHHLPANKWHRTLDRYFHEYVDAPQLVGAAPLAVAA